MAGKKKEPLKLKEDTLEVGLDRYRKPEKKVPDWLVEFGPVVFIGLLLVILAGPLWMFRDSLFSSSPGTAAPMARLKVLGEPMKVWVQGSTTDLESVRVSVANSGVVRAENVEVSVRARDKDFVLKGVSTIASGKMEVFEGPMRISLRATDSLVVTARCSNCQ